MNFIQQQALKKMAFPTINGIVYLEISEISYIQSLSNYCKLMTVNKEEFFVNHSLKCMETIMKKHHFLRIHKSYLINTFKIRKYLKKANGAVVMECNTKLNLGKNKKKLLISSLSQIYST